MELCFGSVVAACYYSIVGQLFRSRLMAYCCVNKHALSSEGSYEPSPARARRPSQPSAVELYIQL